MIIVCMQVYRLDFETDFTTALFLFLDMRYLECNSHEASAHIHYRAMHPYLMKLEYSSSCTLTQHECDIPPAYLLDAGV